MAGSDHVQVEAEEQQIPQHAHVRARLRPLARHLELHNTHLPPAGTQYSVLSGADRGSIQQKPSVLLPGPGVSAGRGTHSACTQYAISMHSVCH